MTRGGAHYDEEGNCLTGRKPMDPALRKVSMGTRVRPDHLAWLREPGRNGAKTIEQALDLKRTFDGLALEEQEMVLALVQTFEKGRYRK